MNPFEPPRVSGPEAYDRSRVWSNVGWGLGIVELLVGGTLCFNGLRYGWAADDSLSNVWGTVVIFTGLFGFAVPGSLLFLKGPLRWIAQLFPALAAILGFALLAQGLGLR